MAATRFSKLTVASFSLSAATKTSSTSLSSKLSLPFTLHRHPFPKLSTTKPFSTITAAISTGDKLPNATLSYLNATNPLLPRWHHLPQLRSKVKDVFVMKASKEGSGSLDRKPKKTRFRKHHRGRMKGIACRGNRICFGKYALQALQPAWITSRQIEAGRRAMTRHIRRGGKIWIRIFPDKAVTMRPTETRMGSGKGTPEYWVAVVKPGKFIYEMGGVAENVARKAISIAASKMPIQEVRNKENM